MATPQVRDFRPRSCRRREKQLGFRSRTPASMFTPNAVKCVMWPPTAAGGSRQDCHKDDWSYSQGLLFMLTILAASRRASAAPV